jgi:hypothetical protein
LTINQSQNCAAGASPYAIAHRCSPKEIQNAAIFAGGLLVMIAGCFAIAFTLGSNAMFVFMGASFASTATAILIAGAHFLLIMAVIWGLLGLSFIIGGGIAWRRKLAARDLIGTRPQILG